MARDKILWDGQHPSNSKDHTHAYDVIVLAMLVTVLAMLVTVLAMLVTVSAMLVTVSAMLVTVLAMLVTVLAMLAMLCLALRPHPDNILWREVHTI